MKLTLTILIGVALVTFSWGWLMNVHYGHLTTDEYIHRYLLKTELFCDGSVEKAKDAVHYISTKHIVRPQLQALD